MKETFKTIPVPHPDSLEVFQDLEKIEPCSMHGQPKVIWHKAEGCYVYDEFGNKFIDFTSGVLITNCGHNHPRINTAIKRVLDQGLLTSYIFVNKERVQLINSILKHSPKELDQVLLFCTGSEAMEVAIKLAKSFSITNRSPAKNKVISFNGSFHGRTLGSQLVGGIASLKNWIGCDNGEYLQMPFPDSEMNDTCDFDIFINHVIDKKFMPQQVSCLIFETYQGGVVKFSPPNFMKKLHEWCKKNDIVMIFDEVQAGFGRTGKWWGFEHYNIVPDLIVCGKGISSSLPVSAVIGKRNLMDQFPPGALSTTHSGNPICAAAATENIAILEEEGLIENARLIGGYMHEKIKIVISKYNERILGAYGKGLVCGIHFKEPADAQKVVTMCVSLGLMLFNPVGENGTTIKFSPPLVISKDILLQGIEIFETCLEHVFGSNS